MKNNNGFISFFLITSFTFLSFCCKKEVGDTSPKVKYEQTQCSDAWASATTDAELINNIAAYLTSKNLPFMRITFENSNSSGIVCAACDCKTGRKIVVSINESDRQAYEVIGFR